MARLMKVLCVVFIAQFMGAMEGAAQSPSDVRHYVKLGALIPVSEVPFSGPNLVGNHRLGISPVIGITREEWRRSTLGWRAGIDGAWVRPVATVVAPTCSGGSCEYKGPSGPLLQTSLSVVAAAGRAHALAGVGARFLHLPSSGDCWADNYACLPIGEARRRPALSALGMVGGGVRLRWNGRPMMLEVVDGISRYEGRWEHEIVVAVGFGW